MNSKKLLRVTIALLATLMVHSLLAQTSTNQPGAADSMAAMMELGRPGQNHQVFTNLVGTWSYNVKWWMNPQSPPMESAGTSVCTSEMGGRYFISKDSSTMMGMDFQGMAIEGYDNVKKKYVSSWIDSTGTGIYNSEGTYDPATKTLTYIGSYEMMPGMKVVMRQKTTFTDADHHTMEMFTTMGGTESKTMEITYTRKS